MNSELAEFALQINEKIQIKAAASMILDGDAPEEEYESQGEALASGEDSDGEDGFDASENEEAVTERVSNWNSKVAEALSAIGSYLSPDSVREREERRANTAYDLLLFQSTLSELREAQTRNRQLSSDLNSVARRADKADLQNTILTEKVEKLMANVQRLEDEIRLMKRTRHHRHTDSDSESDSPRKRRRR